MISPPLLSCKMLTGNIGFVKHWTLTLDICLVRFPNHYQVSWGTWLIYVWCWTSTARLKHLCFCVNDGITWYSYTWHNLNHCTGLDTDRFNICFLLFLADFDVPLLVVLLVSTMMIHRNILEMFINMGGASKNLDLSNSWQACRCPDCTTGGRVQPCPALLSGRLLWSCSTKPLDRSSTLSTFRCRTHSLRCHTGIGRREEGGRVFGGRGGGGARAEEAAHQGGQRGELPCRRWLKVVWVLLRYRINILGWIEVQGGERAYRRTGSTGVFLF